MIEWAFSYKPRNRLVFSKVSNSGGLHTLEWLSRPLVADGVVVAELLEADRLTDADLFAVCLRMHAVLNTVEMPRCEGRLMPIRLFEAIDSLTDRLRHPGDRPPQMVEWTATIREFGEYYGLAGSGPIIVNPTLWNEAVLRFASV